MQGSLRFELYLKIIWKRDVRLIMFVCCRSFLGVCSRLQNTLGSLWKVVEESSFPTQNALTQQLIGAMRALNDVRNQGIFVVLLLILICWL